MSTKKFSELSALTQLADADLFAVTDTDNSQSKKIVASDVTNYILSDANIQAKRTNIITKINELNPTTGNGLKAQELFANGAYRTGTYLLNYNNLSGKPTIPADISDLTNNTNFVSYDTASAKLRITGTGSTAQTITSDYVTEGSTNLFYTDPRVDARQELNFGNLFNTYSSAFDGGEIRESLQDVAGVWQSISSEQSNTLRITDKTVESTFSVGQLLRVYGASANLDTAIAANSIPGCTVALAGFTNTTSTGHKVFDYKLAFYNLKTGEIGPASAAFSTNVDDATNDDVLGKFNTDNFVTLDITGESSTTGVLVYRQIASAGYKLIAVLGQKDLQQVWKDYYTFDYTSWSGKSATDNSYTSITHFPLTPPSGPLKGWTDLTITSINSQSGFFELGFGTTYAYVDADGVAQIAHNDTNKINDAIITKSAQGRKNITLNAKTYNASHISIPNNFGLNGTANITKIKKLPWSGYRADTPDNSLMYTASSTNANTISLVDIDFDGNLANQYLHIDDADVARNYLFDFGTNPQSVILERIRIRNVVGGGVYASSPNELKFSTGEIVNSGTTDRYTFSPLIADAGTTTIVTSNRFENFTDSIDVSVTSEGVVANNIVKACGSGLFVYGSTFLLSSPNVLMGAANEFLASPDILNSEFDSVNIPRAYFGAAAPYSSDIFSYQENGAAFNISQTSISTDAGELVYRANLVRKLSNGSEEEYGNLVGAGATGINGNGFSTVTNDGFVSGKRYRIVDNTSTNWTAIGAPNGNVGTVFTYNGVTVTGSGGTATPDEFTGYPNQSTGTTGTATKPIYITDISVGVDRTLGQFKFEINDTTASASTWTNLKTGIYSQGNLTSLYAANTKTSVSDATKIHPFGSQHVGIGWSVSYRYYVNAGTITGAGTWNTTDTTNPSYTVKVKPTALNVPLANGNVVKIDGHVSFSLGTAVNYGEITNIGTPDGQGERNITIKFWAGGSGSTGAGVAPGTATGTINIIDDFIMAKGLIK